MVSNRPPVPRIYSAVAVNFRLQLSVAAFVHIGHQCLVAHLYGTGVAKLVKGIVISKSIVVDLCQAVVGIVGVADRGIPTADGQRQPKGSL